MCLYGPGAGHRKRLVLVHCADRGWGPGVREEEYRKLQSFSFANIDHFRVSSLVTRLTSDVTNIQNAVSSGLRPACRGR